MFRVLVVFVLASAIAAAQTGAGNIQGVVKDPTGAVIPAAKVLLVRVDTGRAYAATANQVGFYLMPALEPGEYKITAQAEGMQTWEGQMVLRTGQTAGVNVTLAVGGTATEITVAGDVSTLVADGQFHRRRHGGARAHRAVAAERPRARQPDPVHHAGRRGRNRISAASTA